MKQSCNIIKDLLILYEDGACSEDSRKVVEEHLNDCAACSQYFRKIQCTDEVIEEELKEELTKDNQAVKKGLKKIRRRWMLSLAAVLLLIPIIGIGIMGYHEAHDEGVAFTNLDDVYRCTRFLKYIENKEFEKAAEMVDFTQDEYTLVESVADMTPGEYQGYMEERFIKKLQEYDALGLYIDNITYDYSYRANGNRWTVCMAFDENYPDGSEKKIIAHLNGETMRAGAYSYPYMGKAATDDYIDEILYLYSEDDVLDYQDYEVTFELKEGEKAIVSWKNNADLEHMVGLFNITYGTGAALVREPYSQDFFETSVPGKYSVCRFDSAGEPIYFTEEDIDIEIVKYKN